MGGIFTQAVAGDVFGLGAGNAEVLFEDPGNGGRHGHDRRLGVFGQGQLVLGAVEHHRRQLLAQGLVDFGEDVAGG